MADLQRKTANLLNTDQSAQGDGYVDNALLKDGNIIIDTTAFFVTEYIPVTVGTYYYYNNLFRTTIGYINYYNSNKIHLGNVQQTPVMTQGTYNLTALTIPSGVSYIRMSIDKQSTQNCLYTSQLPSYEPYWQHSLRKLTTATETIQSGDTIYANGQPITTYNIKGNEEHTGTPSPSNPVVPNGVGDKTANLFDVSTVGAIPYTDANGTPSANKGTLSNNIFNCTYGYYGSRIYINQLVALTAGTYTFSADIKSSDNNGALRIIKDDSTVIFTETYTDISTAYSRKSKTFTVDSDCNIRISLQGKGDAQTSQSLDFTFTNLMLCAGTSTTYEPYGQYKIPISSVQTVNNYLGSIQSTRQIQKLVLTGDETLSYRVQPPLFIINIPTNHFIPRVTALCTEYNYNSAQSSILANSQHGDFGLQYVNERDEYNVWFNNSTFSTNDEFKAYLAQQYANGTPVTVWYVLQTATTGIVNNPLMKIGDYADSISNATAIPTTDGANSITVDTTVQPSEFTATWTGWHDSSVKEYDGSDWQ